MNPTAMLIAALVTLPAVGAAAWAWFTMAQVEEDLRSFSGFDGVDFEIGPLAARSTEGPR